MQPVIRVEGVTYWVIEDPKQLRRFINTNIRHEWLKDAETDGIDPSIDPWLQNLSTTHWSLKPIRIVSVKLNASMMRQKEFVARLEQRSNELRRGIEVYDQVIWPLIVRGEDTMLKDGYCRYTTLKGMRVKRALAYIGE